MLLAGLDLPARRTVTLLGTPHAEAAAAEQALQRARRVGRFIENDTPWAHIDIAGMAWKPANGDPKEPSWASGYGVRLLDQLIADSYEDKA